MAKSNNGFSWIPRILSILIILFIGMFAMDSFNPELSFLKQAGDFLVHIVPALLLLLLLIIAWKRELLGGILFILLSLIVTPFLYTMNYERTQSVLASIGVILLISLPVLVAGVLFVVSFSKKKEQVPIPAPKPESEV
jgi:hypothetical protein